MSGTVIIECLAHCKHDFQDEAYRGKRVHNLNPAGNIGRCTVCSNTRPVETKNTKNQ